MNGFGGDRGGTGYERSPPATSRFGGNGSSRFGGPGSGGRQSLTGEYQRIQLPKPPVRSNPNTTNASRLAAREVESRSKPNPFGDAKPVHLKPKHVDTRTQSSVGATDDNKSTSSFTSSSSRVNPFGSAKPVDTNHLKAPESAKSTRKSSSSTFVPPKKIDPFGTKPVDTAATYRKDTNAAAPKRSSNPFGEARAVDTSKMYNEKSKSSVDSKNAKDQASTGRAGMFGTSIGKQPSISSRTSIRRNGSKVKNNQASNTSSTKGTKPSVSNTSNSDIPSKPAKSKNADALPAKDNEKIADSNTTTTTSASNSTNHKQTTKEGDNRSTINENTVSKTNDDDDDDGWQMAKPKKKKKKNDRRKNGGRSGRGGKDIDGSGSKSGNGSKGKSTRGKRGLDTSSSVPGGEKKSSNAKQRSPRSPGRFSNKKKKPQKQNSRWSKEASEKSSKQTTEPKSSQQSVPKKPELVKPVQPTNKRADALGAAQMSSASPDNIKRHIDGNTRNRADKRVPATQNKRWSQDGSNERDLTPPQVTNTRMAGLERDGDLVPQHLKAPVPTNTRMNRVGLDRDRNPRLKAPVPTNSSRFADLDRDRDVPRDLKPPVAGNQRWQGDSGTPPKRDLQPPVVNNSRWQGENDGRDRSAAPRDLQPPVANNKRWQGDEGLSSSSTRVDVQDLPPPVAGNKRWQNDTDVSNGAKSPTSTTSTTGASTASSAVPREKPSFAKDGPKREKPSFAKDGPKGLRSGVGVFSAVGVRGNTDMYGRVKQQDTQVAAAAMPTIPLIAEEEVPQQNVQPVLRDYVAKLDLTEEEIAAKANLSEEKLQKERRSVAGWVREYVSLLHYKPEEAAEEVDYYMGKMAKISRGLWLDVPMVALRSAVDNSDPSREKQKAFAEGIGPLFQLLREKYVDSDALMTAFQAVGTEVPDLVLDNPMAATYFGVILRHSIASCAVMDIQIRDNDIRKLGGLDPVTPEMVKAYALFGEPLSEKGHEVDEEGGDVDAPKLLRCVLGLGLAKVGLSANLMCPGEDEGTFEVEILKTHKEVLASALYQASPNVQLAALVEVQKFVASVGYAPKLAEATMMTMYDHDILPEDAFFMWRDDENDVPGKQQCLEEVIEWMTWLASTGESSSDEESSDDDDDSDDSDDDDDDSDSDSSSGESE
jgi:hypothetical protein